MDPFISDHRRRKETERFQEDVAFKFKLENLPVTITNVDPFTKTVVCQASYPDFLLAKKIGTKKGWTVTQ